MDATYLGIDPGRNGAAVLLSAEREVIDAWWWKPAKNAGYYVDMQSGPKEHWQSLTLLGAYIGHPRRVAVEALFVGRSRQTVVGTAETAGELIGAVFTAAEGKPCDIVRPMAARWRADLLGLPSRTKAADADRYAADVVRRVLGDLRAWRCGHAVDAACLAMWAAGVRGKKRG